MIIERIRLEGRLVVVSGAGGGGIGSLTARAMAEAGATVMAVDIRPEPLEALAADLDADGLGIVPVIADVSTDGGVATIGDAIDRLGVEGGVHGLVNIVGGALAPDWGPTMSLSRDSWHSTLTRNLDTAMFLSQTVARRMAAGHGGSIVCLASTSGIGAAPYHAAYGAAKGALVALVRTLGVEWAHHGIRVNAIAPGTVTTPRTGVDPKDAEIDRRGVPMARRGHPSEIASVALFLVSDLASYITGQCLAVDGGTSVKHVHLDDDNAPLFVRNTEILAKIHS